MRLRKDSYVDIAEKAIKKLSGEKNKNGKPIPLVTTSKIRNLLAMTADIYNEVVNSKEETLSSELIGRINYMKIRFIYEAGREPKVRRIVEEADILSHLDEINGSRKQYILFSHYMEALVAYRKFYGGKDE